MLNKRKQDRINVENALTDITDGYRAYTDCKVEDISFNGVNISGIPKKFNDESTNCKGILIIDGENIRVNLKPMWVIEQSTGKKQIGFLINGVNPRLTGKVVELLHNEKGDIWWTNN